MVRIHIVSLGTLTAVTRVKSVPCSNTSCSVSHTVSRRTQEIRRVSRRSSKRNFEYSKVFPFAFTILRCNPSGPCGKWSTTRKSKRKLCKSAVGYATTNDPTTNECYNEQFLSIKSGCYKENR